MVSAYSTLMSALLVGLFFLFERRLGVSVRGALLASALLATTTYVASMSVFFLQHTTEGLTILAGFYGFYSFKRSGRWAALAVGSLVASATLLIRIPGCLAAPGLVGYVVSILRRRKITGRALLCVAAPAAAVLHLPSALPSPPISVPAQVCLVTKT